MIRIILLVPQSCFRSQSENRAENVSQDSITHSSGPSSASLEQPDLEHALSLLPGPDPSSVKRRRMLAMEIKLSVHTYSMHIHYDKKIANNLNNRIVAT